MTLTNRRQECTTQGEKLNAKRLTEILLNICSCMASVIYKIQGHDPFRM